MLTPTPPPVSGLDKTRIFGEHSASIRLRMVQSFLTQRAEKRSAAIAIARRAAMFGEQQTPTSPATSRPPSPRRRRAGRRASKFHRQTCTVFVEPVVTQPTVIAAAKPSAAMLMSVEEVRRCGEAYRHIVSLNLDVAASLTVDQLPPMASFAEVLWGLQRLGVFFISNDDLARRIAAVVGDDETAAVSFQQFLEVYHERVVQLASEATARGAKRIADDTLGAAFVSLADRPGDASARQSRVEGALRDVGCRVALDEDFDDDGFVPVDTDAEAARVRAGTAEAEEAATCARPLKGWVPANPNAAAAATAVEQEAFLEFVPCETSAGERAGYTHHDGVHGWGYYLVDTTAAERDRTRRRSSQGLSGPPTQILQAAIANVDSDEAADDGVDSGNAVGDDNIEQRLMRCFALRRRADAMSSAMASIKEDAQDEGPSLRAQPSSQWGAALAEQSRSAAFSAERRDYWAEIRSVLKVVPPTEQAPPRFMRLLQLLQSEADSMHFLSRYDREALLREQRLINVFVATISHYVAHLQATKQMSRFQCVLDRSVHPRTRRQLFIEIADDEEWRRWQQRCAEVEASSDCGDGSVDFAAKLRDLDEMLRSAQLYASPTEPTEGTDAPDAMRLTATNLEVLRGENDADVGFETVDDDDDAAERVVGLEEFMGLFDSYRTYHAAGNVGAFSLRSRKSSNVARDRTSGALTDAQLHALTDSLGRNAASLDASRQQPSPTRRKRGGLKRATSEAATIGAAPAESPHRKQADRTPMMQEMLRGSRRSVAPRLAVERWRDGEHGREAGRQWNRQVSRLPPPPRAAAIVRRPAVIPRVASLSRCSMQSAREARAATPVVALRPASRLLEGYTGMHAEQQSWRARATARSTR
jgi:hypothetical protein